MRRNCARRKTDADLQWVGSAGVTTSGEVSLTELFLPVAGCRGDFSSPKDEEVLILDRRRGRRRYNFRTQSLMAVPR